MKTYAISKTRKGPSNRCLFISSHFYPSAVENTFYGTKWYLLYPPWDKVKELKVLKIL